MNEATLPTTEQCDGLPHHGSIDPVIRCDLEIAAEELG